MLLCEHSICTNRITQHSKSLFCDIHKNSYIIALDFNNLYGECMSHKLPSGNFQTINNEEIMLMNKIYSKINKK